MSEMISGFWNVQKIGFQQNSRIKVKGMNKEINLVSDFVTISFYLSMLLKPSV